MIFDITWLGTYVNRCCIALLLHLLDRKSLVNNNVGV